MLRLNECVKSIVRVKKAVQSYTSFQYVSTDLGVINSDKQLIFRVHDKHKENSRIKAGSKLALALPYTLTRTVQEVCATSSSMSVVDNLDAQSVCSSNSVASSVHEIIVIETDKRKQRINRIKRHRKKQAKPDADISYQDSDLGSTASSIATNTGIMSVRTLEESLDNGQLTKMRKLRRKITIKFKSGDSAIEGDESISLASRSACSIATDISIDFSKVHVREFEVVPGLNPSCSSGPPIELGWRHGETLDFDVEGFERVRDGRRRLQAQMRMPPDARRGLLLHHGSSQKMIREATKSCAAVRKERMETLCKMSQKKKNSISGVKKLFQFGKKK